MILSSGIPWLCRIWRANRFLKILIVYFFDYIPDRHGRYQLDGSSSTTHLIQQSIQPSFVPHCCKVFCQAQNALGQVFQQVSTLQKCIVNIKCYHSIEIMSKKPLYTLVAVLSEAFFHEFATLSKMIVLNSDISLNLWRGWRMKIPFFGKLRVKLKVMPVLEQQVAVISHNRNG